MADIKDRHSNMASSSVNAQPTKDGAGGAYTWGSKTDVTDFVAAGVDTSQVGVQTRVVQVAPVVVQAAPYQAIATDFPAIGNPAQPRIVQWGAPAGAGVVMPPNVSAVAPTTGSVVLTQPREGVTFDQGHPRNQFARLPVHTPSTGVVQAIDWSTGGMPSQVQTAIIQAGGGRAHLSPVAMAAPVQPVPMTVMRTQVAQAPVFTPTVVKSHKPVTKIIQQPRR
jgi:hypothetical protein